LYDLIYFFSGQVRTMLVQDIPYQPPLGGPAVPERA
jgi:hypothetical protein